MTNKTSKPKILGTVWCVEAKLFDRNKKLIGICLDTPNAIAKAMMEWDKIQFVKEFGTSAYKPKKAYQDRMQSWNEAESMLKKY